MKVELVRMSLDLCQGGDCNIWCGPGTPTPCTQDGGGGGGGGGPCNCRFQMLNFKPNKF